MAAQSSPPPVIDGMVIGRSVGKSVSMIGVGIMCFVIGVGLIYLKIAGITFLGGKEVTWWGLLIGIAGVVFAPIIILATVHLVRVKNRIVIGQDRLQIVQNVSGQPRVMTQVPFANIAELAVDNGDAGNVVGITLHSLDDPESYPGREKFEGEQKMNERHVVILSGYERSVTEIADEIRQRLARMPRKA